MSIIRKFILSPLSLISLRVLYRAAPMIVAVTLTVNPLTTSAVQADDAISWNASATFVTDYRFRGVSFSSHDAAVQAGVTATTSSGFFLGVWGSSIQSYGGSELEMDIFGGYNGQLSENISYTVGLLAYTYPGSDNTHYFEGYGSVSGAVDKLSWTVGAAYAPDQDNIGMRQGDFYLYTSASYPLSDALSLSAYVAREKGAFGRLDGDAKFDWSLGASYNLTDKISLGVSYIDTNYDSSLGKATVVASLSASF